MGKHRWSSWLACLRHWRGVVQVLLLLGLGGGAAYAAVGLIGWIGPAEVVETSGDETEDFRAAQRAAFAEVGRCVKVGLVVLGVVAVFVVLAVILSRTPISFSRSNRKESKARDKSREGRSKSSRGDAGEDRHNTIFIDPDTLEDHS